LKPSGNSKKRVRTVSPKSSPKSGGSKSVRGRIVKQGKNLSALPGSDDPFAQRYAKNWTEISLACRRATKFLCCFPGCKAKATDAHHALYKDAQGVIAGRELPGIHVFGLCDKHHAKTGKDAAHSPRNWVKGTKAKEYLDAHQKVHFYEKLRQGWAEKTTYKRIRGTAI
jgi:hypothetical protein